MLEKIVEHASMIQLLKLQLGILYILSDTDKYDKYWLAISLRVTVDDYFNIKITQML